MSGEINRVSLVTGAARGIGRAIADRLANCGDVVVLVDRDVAAGERAQAELGARALFVAADVRSAAEVQGAVDLTVSRFGRLDAVVNNAGVNTYNDPVEMSEEEWDDAFAVDVKACWLLARAAIPHLLASDSAAIVNISSIHARHTTSGMFPYAAAKAAVEGMTRSLAVEYGSSGVRVNAVAPGWTRTYLVDEWLQRQQRPAAAMAAVDAAHPLGRIAEPSEVAAVVAFLLGPDASAVTGAVFPVDCGLSARFAT